MKPKKILFDIFVIAIAFLLFIDWYDKSKIASVPTAAVQNNYKIYLITKDKREQFWSILNQGAANMAAMLGVTYIWKAPEKNDAALQIELLNNAVNDGADAVLIAVSDSEKLSEPIRNAKAKGTKIVYVDAPANEEAVTTLATNNYDAGILAGENMINELELFGIEKGKIGIIGYNTTTDTTMNREAGFRDTILADGKFTLLDTEYMEGDRVASQKAAERLIKDNKDMVGLFGTNEGSSEGVGNAIKADNNRVIGIGFNKSDLILKLIQEESLKAVIVQNPFTMGYLGMAEAIAAIKGYDSGPPFLNTGASVLRKR